jgi:hypothetical protein
MFFYLKSVCSKYRTRLKSTIVRKKTEEICLCIDLWDLNKERIKDNYPLPNMEMLLQQFSQGTLTIITSMFGSIIRGQGIKG